MYTKAILCLSVLALALIPAPGFPAEPSDLPGNLRVGPIRVHPGMSITQEYNDNLFREPSHEKGAAVTTVSPGVVLQLPFRRHFLELDYHADIIEAARYNSQYDTDSHFLNALLTLDFNRLNIQAGNDWASDSTPPDSKNDIRNNYFRNMAFAEASYQLPGRYRFRTFYRNEYRSFDSFHKPGQFDPRLDDYMLNDVGANLFYRFLPLTSALVEYGFTHTNNRDMGLPSTDSDAHRIWLGLSWEPTAKITGSLKGGYVTRNYDGPADDWDGFGMEGDVRYKLTPRYTITFNGFRRILETSVTQEEGVYGTYYVSTGGTLGLDRAFTPKLSATIDVAYFYNDYRERGLIGKKRSDDLWGFGCGATYQIQKWLETTLKYTLWDNDSNISAEDYTENRIMGTVAVIF